MNCVYRVYGPYVMLSWVTICVLLFRVLPLDYVAITWYYFYINSDLY